MAYLIVIKRQAKKVLQSLSRPDKTRITEKITKLGLNPDDLTLDTKHLNGSMLYRLRVGDWRIIFSKDDEVKIVSIEKIKPRGEAYK